jgi:glycosyltransferase involved in cell wall biosynthesis
MGRMGPQKAPHIAIEAARRADVPIVLAGKMSTVDEHEYFEEKVAPLLDGSRVAYFGEADARQKRELYAGARALLVPSQWEEPFGLVMIEAMACGTPVIAFNRGAAPELVRHGDNGFLVHDAAGMANALALVHEISPACCREYVEQRFTPGALADGYLAVYAKILREQRSADDPFSIGPNHRGNLSPAG